MWRGFMTQDEETELRAQLARLRQEHRDLDAAIGALQARAYMPVRLFEIHELRATFDLDAERG